MPDRSACLDENAVDALLAGRLDDAEAAAVDAHIDGCVECLALVAALARTASIVHDPVAGPEPAVTPVDEALARGTRVGRYEIEALVGVGAMGAVYAAVDSALHRTVALKLVRARRGDDAAERTERLLREARTMAKLAHPNVVAVHDVGTFGERVFVAMELVEGDTLRRWLEAPRAREEVLATFIAAGRGLAAAHEADVIHRDFKPENVLVGADGRVLVTDFGLARGPAADDERPGTVAGTPAYMAPEQLRGEEVDARADQFSFCVALYEALVGERPFQGNRLAELAASIDAQALPEPRTPRVPPHVRRALRRGLARAPEERFPSMHALLDVLSRDPAARVRLVALVALGAAVVVATAAFTVSAIRHERSSCRAGVRAKLDLVWGPGQRAAIHDAFLASNLSYAEDAWMRVASGLDAAAASWSAMHVEACDATHARAEQSPELLDLRVACLDDHLREMGTLVDVLAHADLDVVKNAVAAVQALAPLHRCADTLALRAVVAPPPERAAEIAAVREELARAKALRDAGRVRESLDTAREASRRSSSVDYPPLAALALLRVGEAEMELREGDAGADTLRRAAHLADAANDDLTRADALTRRLFVEAYLLHHGDRLEELDGEVSGVIARAGGGAELEGNYRHALGMALIADGKLEQARAAMEQAVKLREAAYGAHSRQVAMSRNGLCLLADREGDQVEALRHCERALEIWVDVLGPHHPDVAIGMSNVGATLEDLGRHEEACARFERALAILEAALGTDHPVVAATLSNLGEASSRLGDHTRAIAALDRALAIRERLPAIAEPGVDVILTNLAQAYLRAGNATKARDTFELALARVTSDHKRVEIALGLASALWEIGDARSRQRARRTAADGKAASADSAERRVLDQWLASHP